MHMGRFCESWVIIYGAGQSDILDSPGTEQVVSKLSSPVAQRWKVATTHRIL
jgi:hypothetical protein